MTSIAISFILCLLGFVAIGALSIRRKRESIEDYLTASHNVPAWLVALSSVATNNSGYMFVGLIGYTYLQGLSAIWLIGGWMFGDWLAWHSVHPRLRRLSDRIPVNTISGLIARGPNGEMRSLTILTAMVTLLFLSVYAAAQLTAGSKALHVMFDWPVGLGAFLGAFIVVTYSFVGGIRASIWTDAAQAGVMILAMLALLTVGIMEIGPPQTLYSALKETDPMLVNLVPPDLSFGLAPFLMGWIAAGIGVAGQPHILIRTVALSDARDIPRARRVYFAWYIPFATMTLAVALYARILLPDTDMFDPELALPSLAVSFLPGIWVGLILAGLFAATMSTADSMLLSCSAAVSQDLFPKFGQSYMRTKVATISVTAVVLIVALAAPANVFTLVIVAWSGLAATLGPILIVRVVEAPIGARTAFLMVIVGFLVVVLWRFGFELSDDINESLPGMAAGFAVYTLSRMKQRLWA